MPSLDLRSILTKVRNFLAAIAPLTPIKTDDSLVAVLDAVLVDADLFGWLSAKVDQSASGVLSLETDPPVALQVVLEQRSINWQQLLSALPVIIEFVRMFRG